MITQIYLKKCLLVFLTPAISLWERVLARCSLPVQPLSWMSPFSLLHQDTANSRIALAASPSLFFTLLPVVGPSWSLHCDSSFKGLTTQCLLISFQQLWLNRHTSLAVPLCEQLMVHLHWISTRWALQIFEMSIHLIMSKRAANTTEWHQGNIQHTQWHI